jgi:FixJ family two-component response regulator
MNPKHADAHDELTVYVVDDDADVRHAVGLLLKLRGYRTALFESAEQFLSALRVDTAGCLITDIRMPGLSGLQLQQELASRCRTLPVVVLTAHGSVASARTALRAQAVDFLTKPFKQEELVAAIELAYERSRAELGQARMKAIDRALVDSLTPREREVAALLATGAQNLDIARRLDISPRTVEIHKARCMEKLRARTLADLVRLIDRSGLRAEGDT